MKYRRTRFTLAFVAATAGACDKKEPSNGSAPSEAAAAGAPPPPSTQGAAAADAPTPPQAPADVFKTHCAVCHGEAGHGDGPGAAALDPKPRAFANADWQASVKDEDLSKIIIEGDPAVGKSPLMPPNLDLKEKPEVVSGLVQIIRDFKE